MCEIFQEACTSGQMEMAQWLLETFKPVLTKPARHVRHNADDDDDDDDDHDGDDHDAAAAAAAAAAEDGDDDDDDGDDDDYDTDVHIDWPMFEIRKLYLHKSWTEVGWTVLKMVGVRSKGRLLSVAEWLVGVFNLRPTSMRGVNGIGADDDDDDDDNDDDDDDFYYAHDLDLNNFFLTACMLGELGMVKLAFSFKRLSLDVKRRGRKFARHREIADWLSSKLSKREKKDKEGKKEGREVVKEEEDGDDGDDGDDDDDAEEEVEEEINIMDEGGHPGALHLYFFIFLCVHFFLFIYLFIHIFIYVFDNVFVYLCVLKSTLLTNTLV